MSMHRDFEGNAPRNVSRDAKYVVRSGRDGPVVALTYLSDDDERWLMTTENHPDLVAAVNEVKTAQGDAPNGPFYINEHGQVIVPVGADATYYVALEHYDSPLEFRFEGKTLSGRAVDLDGRSLDPGDAWTGPHPGIPYVLAAGGGDVYYRSHPRPNVTKDVKLSKAAGAVAAKEFAARIRAVKGWQGGRFYVNEWCEIFAPVPGSEGVAYTYIGPLDSEEPWFPKV